MTFPEKRKKKIFTLQQQRSRAARILIIPGLSMYVPFHLFPILAVMLMSFVRWKGYSFNTIKWIGLENYKQLLSDPYFWKSLWHNLEFVLIVVIVQTTIALVLAILLERKLPLTKFFRGIYFMPTVLSLVVVGLLFGFILSPSQGLLNTMLRALGSSSPPAWLGNPKIALFVIMAITTWKEFGLSMFLFIAGLESIPEELFDAAKVDGAGQLKIVTKIILPLLAETATVVMMLITISCFKLFDLIQVMTKGGPFFATEVLATRMYTQSFKYGKMGYGSAIAIVLFIITFAFSAFQFWYRTRNEKVEY